MQNPTRPNRSSSTLARTARKSIDALAQGPFETVDAQALGDVLNTVDPEVAEVLVEIYDESTLAGILVAIVVGSIVALFGDSLRSGCPARGSKMTSLRMRRSARSYGTRRSLGFT
jgi:hypothetical protein